MHSVWIAAIIRLALNFTLRLQNSPYYCVFKYVRAVKQKVWNEAENRERDWGDKKTDCFAVSLPLFAKYRLAFHSLAEPTENVRSNNPKYQ